MGVSSVPLFDDDVRHVVHFVKLQVLGVKKQQHMTCAEQEISLCTKTKSLLINTGVKFTWSIRTNLKWTSETEKCLATLKELQE